MTACCPTCHQSLPETGVILHVDAGLVIAAGAFVSLPRREMLILDFLYSKIGQFVSKEAIFNAAYTRADTVEFHEVVESHVSKLKKKLLRLGIIIRSERFRGYQLTIGVRP